MKNFEVTSLEDGKKYWISRAVVVAAFTFRWVGKELQVLVEKRGPSVSHTGEYCCPCGYLDWDETCEQAVRREVKEETGITLETGNIKFINFNDRPDSDSRQNIEMRYVCFCKETDEPDISNVETRDEIEEVFWQTIGHQSGKAIVIDHDKLYDGKVWAFGHQRLITQCLTEAFSEMKIPVII